MKASLIGLAAVSLLAAGSAVADEDRGLYLGAGFGQYNVEVDDFSDVSETVGSFDEDDTSFKIFGGWRFNPYIAAELAYLDLGNPSGSVGDLSIDTEVTGFAPYLVGTLPLGIFEVFAKVGYYFYDIEASIRDELDPDFSESLDESDEDFVYGVGAGLVLFDHLNVRLEYEIIDISDTDESNALWLTAAWRF